MKDHYKNMRPIEQKALKRANILRAIWLVICWALVIPFTISFFKITELDNNLYAHQQYLSPNLLHIFGLIWGIVWAGVIYLNVRLRYVYLDLLMLFFLVFVLAFVPIILLMVVANIAGWVVMIIDTLRPIFGLPLIWKSEYDGIIDRYKEKHPIEAGEANRQRQLELTTESSLKDLKDLYEKKLITEEEYAQKKRQILGL